MNLHPGKMELPAAAPRRVESRGARSSYCGPFLFKIMLIFLGFMTVLVIHLYLRQQSVKSAERTEDLDKQIKKVEAETRNLRNHVATLTGWPHISRKIVEFKLALGPAAPGQILRTPVYSPKQAAAIPLTPLSVAAASRRTR